MLTSALGQAAGPAPARAGQRHRRPGGRARPPGQVDRPRGDLPPRPPRRIARSSASSCAWATRWRPGCGPTAWPAGPSPSRCGSTTSAPSPGRRRWPGATDSARPSWARPRSCWPAIDPSPGVRLIGVSVSGLIEGGTRQLTLDDLDGRVVGRRQRGGRRHPGPVRLGARSARPRWPDRAACTCDSTTIEPWGPDDPADDRPTDDRAQAPGRPMAKDVRERSLVPRCCARDAVER